MFRGFSKYKVVYSHLWVTYGASWAIRWSFILHFLTRIGKLVLLPVAASFVIARLSARDFNGAYQAVFVFISISGTIGVIAPITKYIGTKGESRVYQRATADYFAQLMQADLDFFHSNLAGYLTTATRQYVDSTVHLVRSLRDKYMNTIVSILLPLAVIVWIDPWLGLVTIGLGVVLTWYLFWASHAITDLRVLARELFKRNSGRMADIVSNILAIRSSAQEETYVKRVEHDALVEMDAFSKRYAKQAKLISVREAITVSFFFVLLWLSVRWVAEGRIDLAAAIIVITYMNTILTGIYQLSDNLDEHDDYIDKILPAFEILQRKNKIQDPAAPKKLAGVRGEISFDNVSFSYDGGQPVLQNFSLSIPAGQKVGIVGLSGAGKSTLTKLLLRFDDVDDGQVLLDGVDVREVRQTDLRRQIAYVPQEPLLLHSSIKENVLLAQPDATEKEVEKALKISHALHFTQQLPDGIESIVGERGVKLSGGQKQRVAIARAVLRKTPIMVLDEATSALDSESEQIIKDSFTEVLKGKTAIVVAHRLSTLSGMDRIVVIEKGKCMEDGTHEELLAKKGIYAKLWKRQLRREDETL